MNLPRFLIIGAMKSGTTTLYRDLITNPAVFMPQDKEPGNLNTDEVLTDQGLARYAALFAPMRPDQVGGEASTSYTKAPDIPGVPARARKVLGPELRVVYILREPVSRAISHHAHALTIEPGINPDFNIAVRSEPAYLNYSRYAMQAAPWLEAIGPAGVMLLRFEALTKDRRATVERVSAHIGVTSRPDLIDDEAVYNKTEQRVRNTGIAAAISRTAAYRQLVRPLLSPDLRDRIRRAILPRAAIKQIPPTPETVDWMLEQLAPDTVALERLVGASAPAWDPAKIRQKFAASAAPVA
jgi:hypothetical protein